MRATIGDRLHIHNNHTGSADQYGRIVEIRGANGAPPYLVEFPDGHTSLVFPGPDAVVESSGQLGGAAGAVGLRSRRVHTRVGW
jgi:hypothetical protein